MAEKTVAKYIAELCKQKGITSVFWVDAMFRRTLIEMEHLGFKRVLCHSEKAAAYMADGYARVKNGPGICFAQSVGAANLAAGLQDAFLAHTPVIAITGKKPPEEHYRNAYQEIDHWPMYESVTKWNVRIDFAQQVPQMLQQAFRKATTGKPGPVHIDVFGFNGSALEDCIGEYELPNNDFFQNVPGFRSVPEDSLIEKAAENISASAQPVLIAGGGSITSNAADEIVQFCTVNNIPIATTPNGKSVIIEKESLNIGITGDYGRKCTNDLVSESDLVIYVGSSTGDNITKSWTVPPAGKKVIQIDIDPVELGRNMPNCVSLFGDAKLTLKKLNEFSQKIKMPDRKGWCQYAEKKVQDWKEQLSEHFDSNNMPVRPERLMKELTAVLPEDGIIVADTGWSTMWTATMLGIRYPTQKYIKAAGSLGWGFPASLGAKCAAPERPVICFTGDGGFWYHLCELETAKRFGINTVTVVNNNSQFAQCSGKINTYQDKISNLKELYCFSDTNFAKVAEQFGCVGIRVEDPVNISGAISDALQNGKPTVIDVVTDPSAKPPAA